ncbi:MAG: D-alanyl-D-alanine carboxypeptidase [Verrucomicrobiales bacterium]|nr:D-alanyl-D-alanine carboxypeptidase [Verrucomicrobiales bacterium]
MRKLSSFISPRFLGIAIATGLGAMLIGTTGCSTKEPQAPSDGVTSPVPTRPEPGPRYPGLVQGSRHNNHAATAPAEDAPKITAKAAILIDSHGRVLYEKNADARLPCASTQKLLLGIMIAERGGLSQPMTIQEPDTWAEPTKMGIKPGQAYIKADLLRAVLVRSSNDIARALARDHSGSVPAFAANMNVRARQLGMYNSHFTNASGLPTPPGQYSTARDLSKLALASARNGFVRDAIRTKGLYFRFPDGTTKPITNTNQVLRSFPYCTGMKTGYTNAAGRCLVSSASYGGKNVYAVILGSKTPNVWSESEALLRYGLGM